MEKPIRSLHHVTATVTDAQEDLDFYTGLLGQRLVKKTVNFDNTHVYHFYYGNEKGTPGTIMTTLVGLFVALAAPRDSLLATKMYGLLVSSHSTGM